MVSKIPEAHRRMVAEGIFDALSAVSAPPTITDEAIRRAKAEALRDAADAFDGGTINVEIFGNSTEAEWWRRSNETRASLVRSLRKRAAALGGEDKVG